MLVASAIADPVRREVLELLRSRPLTAGQLASEFAVSRPAVSRHLRVLREAGLVTATSSGRERIYSIEVSPLAALDTWLEQFRDGWSNRLDALETEVYRTRREHTRAQDPADRSSKESA